jgi:integrase
VLAGQVLSPRTVRYVATILGRALKDAVRKGLIPRSPHADADPPRPSATSADVMRTWTGEELGSFLDSVEEHRMGALFTFLALTGCRRGEALGLRWSDLDLTDTGGRASIVQTVGKVAGKTVVGTTKTTAGRRVVSLDAGLATVLRQHRRAQNELRLLMGAGWRDLNLVFPSHIGEHLYPETVSRVFRETVDGLELPPIRLHDLRHTWATLALQAKVHPKVVQERLGHANVGITLGTYSHVAPTLHDEAAETVAGSLTRKR